MSRITTPVVLQAEQAECGLASLAMIAGRFGHRIDLATLRRRYQHTNSGPTLQSILSLAGRLGLIARPVRLDLAELRRLTLPAILHWQFDHFVVLTAVRRKGVVVHDPAVGKRRIGLSALSEAFTGVAVEFTRAANFSRESTVGRSLLLGLLRSFDGLPRYLGLMLLLLLVTQTLALAPPIATQLLIDDVVLGKDTRWLYQMLVGVGLVMLTMLVLDVLRRWIALYTGTRLATDSTTAVVDHLFRLPVQTVSQRPVGDLLSRVDSLRPVRAALMNTLLQAVVQLMIVATTIGVMIYYSPTLTVLSIVALLTIVVVHSALLPATRTLNLEAVVASARASNSLIDTLRSFHAVRTLALNTQRLAHWRQAFVAATNAGARQARLGIVASLGQGLVSTLEQLSFLAIGISGVVNKRLTLGILFAFLSLRGRLSSAVMQLIAAAQELYLLRSHLQRVGEIVVEKPEQEAPDAAFREQLDGSIACRQLAFHYPGCAPVFRNFSCCIESGESVIIAGPSGSGKTTLLHLLSMALCPSSGSILIDGIESQLWDVQALRRQFGIVLQHDRLFQGSIADNISCFDQPADLGRVRDAARMAEIWTDIVALPMHLHTPVADSGAGFSGGQLQRLLLSRALYRGPKILFLDEATSHLDDVTERCVLDNLDALKITTISVAHRQSVLARAERILQISPTPQ